MDDGELLVESGDADEVQDIEASTMARSSGSRWPRLGLSPAGDLAAGGGSGCGGSARKQTKSSGRRCQ
jgi:hypothetical protein